MILGNSISMVRGGASTSPTLTITGTLTDGTNPVVFPVLYYAGEYNGFPSYTSDGLAVESTRPSPSYKVYMSGANDWNIWVFDENGTVIAAWTSGDGVSATPDLVATWFPSSPATGTPVLTLNT